MSSLKFAPPHQVGLIRRQMPRGRRYVMGVHRCLQIASPTRTNGAHTNTVHVVGGGGGYWDIYKQGWFIITTKRFSTFFLIARCQDRTENGTFMSGLKCLKCPDGFYLADSPLDCASSWTCTVCKVQAPQVGRGYGVHVPHFCILHGS